MIQKTIYRLAESKRVRNIAMKAANKGVLFVLNPAPRNDQEMMNIKRNLKNAYVVYRRHNPENFNNGKKVGYKLTNSLFKFYEKQANKKKFLNNTPFMKGLKNGVRERVLYWVPGVYVRSVKRKFDYNTSKFMKRAQNVKGVENIYRLFSGNNRNVNRRRNTTAPVR